MITRRRRREVRARRFTKADLDLRKFIPPGMGWLPDLPDPRDYTPAHDVVRALLEELPRSEQNDLPDAVDLRSDDEGVYIFPSEDQGTINCSAACAVCGLVEYFERRIRGQTFEGSRLFLYRLARKIRRPGAEQLDNSGAELRATLKSLKAFGLPNEQFWPFESDLIDREPQQFVYAAAKRFEGLCYFRVSPADGPRTDIVRTLKTFLASGFPIAFGFSVPSSLSIAPEIPFRPTFDSIRGGQAALAVGYRHDQLGRGQDAFLIQTSWGRQWGDNGMGWLPAAYVREGLARDFWTVLSREWLDREVLTSPCCE